MISQFEAKRAMHICGVDPRNTEINFGIPSTCKDDSADNIHEVKNVVTWYQTDTAGVVIRRGRITMDHGRVSEWDMKNSEYKILPFFGDHEHPYEIMYREMRFGPYAECP